jgi:hypothetical protein
MVKRIAPIAKLMLLLLVCAGVLFGRDPEKKSTAGLEKTNASGLYRPFLINNVFNYYSNNGDGSYNKYSSDNEGFEFYKGTGKCVIFEDGVVWGGYHKGRAIAKVGGSVYKHGLVAGKIITNGTATTDPVADDPTLSKYRVYRVRPDINPKLTFDEVSAKIENDEVKFIARYESYSAQDIYNQYISDWNDWPAGDGAPYNDVNKDGKYDPAVDIPGQPGSDQTLWYVSNDTDAPTTNTLAGSPPIGLEMQRTIWGYKRSGALGNVIFASTILINKSGAKIDSMYLVQWSDPDLGYAGDDFAGCDTTRSLGYIYNSQVDATYGVQVPAGGFDFFQGPIVPGKATDQAIFKLQYRQGYKNLPMSAFVFFTQGITAYRDPAQGAGGDIEWYRLMKGTTAAAGAQFIDPITNQPTKFCFAGDPVKATGWNDGGAIPAQDRRICLVTGPFTMAVGDTQELVVANLAGVGADRLSSVSVMKSVDDQAQAAYNNLFSLPAPPPQPLVTASPLDGEIILTWGDPAGVAKTEGTVDQGFVFEGYNLYECPGPSFTDAVKIGTYDVINGVTIITDTVRNANTGLNDILILQMGSDSGPVRSYRTTSSKITNARLINGQKYYFSVTAYSYNANPPAAAGTHSLESAASITTVIPQWPVPGTRYVGNPGDTIQAVKAGASDGSGFALIVDPTRLSGKSYKVTFKTDADGNSLWDVTNTSTGVVVAPNQTNQSGNEDYPLIDGMMVKVIGPPPGMKTWTIPGGTRRFSPVGGNGLGLEGFSNAGDPNAPQDPDNGTIGMGANFPFANTTLSATGYHDVLLKLAVVNNTALWDPKVTPADANYSRAYRYLRGATLAAAKPEFDPWIINKTAGYAYQDFNYSVPFSAWDQSTTPPTRLAVGHLENNVAGGLVDGRWWPGLTTVNNVDAAGPREWLFIFATPYTETPQAQYMINFSGSTVPLMWAMSCARRADAAWVAGDQFGIFSNKVNSPSTVYTWTAPSAVVGDQELAKVDVDKVNVYPNPYIGYNSMEINRYARFVTFTHLPTNATIRIFNLSGVLLRTMVKSDQTQFYQWDLKNTAGFPVSAGVYVAYVEMPDVGKTKILKLTVVPEQQYLDKW